MNNLKAEMTRYGVTVYDVQQVLGCSEKTVRNKINGDTEFTISEALKLKRNLFPSLDLDYLFAVEDKSA